MNILEELTSLLTPVIPIETGVFTGTAPDQYVVLTPLSDTFHLHGDDRPHIDVQEVRISLFSNGNYMHTKNIIVKLLKLADFTITDRRYIGRDDDSSYANYAIDVAKYYETEE